MLRTEIRNMRAAIRIRSVHEDDSAGGLVTGHCDWCGAHWYGKGGEVHLNPMCLAKSLTEL